MTQGYYVKKGLTEADWLLQTTQFRIIPTGVDVDILDVNGDVIYTVTGNGVDDIFDLPRKETNIIASQGVSKNGREINLGGTITEAITILNGIGGTKGKIFLDPEYGIVFQDGDEEGINYAITEKGLVVLNDFSTLNGDNPISKKQLEQYINSIRIESATLSSNNYIISTNYSIHPNEIKFRVSASNPTITPKLSLIIASASPVLYDIVDKLGFSLTTKDLKTGVLYTGQWDTVTSKYRILEIEKESYVSTANQTTTSLTFNTNRNKIVSIYNHTTDGTRTLALEMLRLNEVCFFNCKQNKLTFSAGTNVTLNTLPGGVNTCTASGGFVGVVCVAETVDASGNQLTAEYSLI
jgi:hypothetical protein